jgi:hypothetical protein
MPRRFCVGIALSFLIVSAAWASGSGISSVKAVKAGTDCAGGWQRDDGSFENGFSFVGNLTRVSMAMSFDVTPPARVDAICVCLFRAGTAADASFDGEVDVWAAPDGIPSQNLRRVNATFADVPTTPTFYRVDLPGGIKISEAEVALGLTWFLPAQEANVLYLCNDENGPGGGRGNYLASGPIDGDNFWHDITGITANYRAFGVRAEATSLPPDPAPPAGSWLATSAVPGYDFKVRINGGASGTQVTDCVPETLCVAGAIPTRTELFLRVIGPRPNGFFWVQGVRFSTSRLEVWARDLASTQIRYYDLPAVPTDSDELPGLVDRTAFQP